MPERHPYPSFIATHLGHALYRHPRIAIALGRAESFLLDVSADTKPITGPIYINGLARSGSTMLLELLASHSNVATHRYKDFPFAMAPWWWRHVIALSSLRRHIPRQRAHQDGIMVTPHSPESMEECVWMAFFPHIHDPHHNAVLTREVSHPAFEDFYQQHIIKMLMLEKKDRYLAKGNYNITRMGYLHRLFPDARFVIPIRNPVTHIESLLRQHRLFSKAGRANNLVRMHMQAAGHYEFGPDRRPVNVGHPEVTKAIMEAWDKGADVRGLALLWNDLYGLVHGQLSESPDLNAASYTVRQEAFLANPQQVISHVLEHCQLEPDRAALDAFIVKIRQKKGASPPLLTPKDIETIHSITSETAALFGYKG